jgi:hypothetical protein
VRPWTNTPRKTPQTSFQAQSLPRPLLTNVVNGQPRGIGQPRSSGGESASHRITATICGNTWRVVVQHKGAKHE